MDYATAGTVTRISLTVTRIPRPRRLVVPNDAEAIDH